MIISTEPAHTQPNQPWYLPTRSSFKFAPPLRPLAVCAHESEPIISSPDAVQPAGRPAMAGAELPALLGRLAASARQLNETHSLEEFQRQAAEVCGACELTVQQLARARAALLSTTPAAWEAVADEGVVLTDVVK
jgi:hypothetical protein